MKNINLSNNTIEDSFFIYYGNAACVHKLGEYETLILDPDNYRDVTSFNSCTYAYLSLGEVNSFRSYFDDLKNNNKLLEKNHIWDSYLIKFDSFWEELVLKTIIPNIIKSGYDGIMIDTIDTIIYNKTTSKENLKEFINSIKEIYPNFKIMVNRAFEIINDLSVDSILLESTISTHDFETKEYLLHEEPHNIEVKDSIKCYSVDYWHINDNKMIDKIRSVAIQKGYTPLVTDIKLQEIP